MPEQASPAQHSSSAASASAAEASSAAAGGIARDGLGWPLGGMKAGATVFHDMSGVGGQTSGGLFGGSGGTVPTGQTGGGAPNPGGRWSLYDEKLVLNGKMFTTPRHHRRPGLSCWPLDRSR